MSKHVLLFVVLAIALTTSPVFADKPQGTLKKIIADRIIRLGYQRDLPPFSSAGVDGKPKGYSIELCHRLVAGIHNEYNLAALDINGSR